ncbi:tetratricopeptide repeat protein [Helicobacter sp.]|uniref:tetratricopeptide repeat protein n=1 Tax=Helicobacter sp. TaxID=218 RepID=UPI002589FF74|nr:tetratricopeptide repeat protein [Helicobacter sp.]MCI7765661.1 tetratricopeptide repeat protein [Helicobacter sp.]
MLKQIGVVLVLANLLFAEEPSAFNAGGDTLMKTKEQIIDEKLFNLSSKVKNLEVSQEGLKSVFEGQLQRIQEVSHELNTRVDENNATIANIKEYMEANFATQNENIQKLQQSIAALGELIQKVDMQTKSEIDVIKKMLLDEGQQEKKEVKKNNSNPRQIDAKVAEELRDKPLAEVFAEGEKLLEQKQYKIASEYFKKAVDGHYKPARGNYLLGESAFYQGKYEEAIQYYKISAERYDKADYMPLLMLHTAQAFKKLNNNENALKFLESLVALYPDSKESQEAKKLLFK